MALSGSVTQTHSVTTLGSTYTYKLTFTWQVVSQSVEENSSTIMWQAQMYYPSGGGITAVNNRTWTAYIDGVEYTGTNGISSGGNTRKVLADGIVKIVHKSGEDRGFIFNFTQEWDVLGDSTKHIAVSGTGVINALPVMATLTTTPNFTDEESPLVKYANPLGVMIDGIEIGIAFGSNTDVDIPYRAVSIPNASEEGSYRFNFTQTEKTAIWNQMPENGETIPVKYFLKTIYGDNTYIDTKNATLTYVNYMPKLAPTVRDTNSRTTSLTGDPNTFIRYFSNATFVTGAAARKGATLESQYIKCGDVIKYNEPSGTIEGVTSNTYYFSATDSRGNTTNDALIKTLIPYVKLTNRLTTKPLTAKGELEFTITGKFFNGSFGAKRNDLEVEFLLEDENGEPVFNTAGSGWVPMGVIEPDVDENYNYSFTYTIEGLNHEATYTLTVNAIDKLMPQPAVASKVIATVPLFDWGKDDFHFHVPVNVCDRLQITNEGQIHGTMADGSLIQAIDPCNGNNNLVIGYGNYADETSTPDGAWAGTNLYGNTVNLMHKNGITINWTPLADFVTEQGTNNTWFYRKWNSGRVELYGYQNVSSVACNTALGNMFRTAVITSPSFPFTVNSPKMVAAYESEGYGAFMWFTTLTTTTKPANYYLVRPTSSAAITGKVNFHIQGSWK